jgi:hypothetical protein
MTTSTRSFSALLNDYLPNKMLTEELVKRDWLLSNVEIDENYKGGTLKVPMRTARASSVSFGALTDSTDVAESAFSVGTISSPAELWGTLKFNHRDLQEHNGKIPETTFLKILPNEIDQFMEYFKEVASTALVVGSTFATATDATNAASGIFIVDRPERFEIGQKCVIDDGDSNPTDVYVTAINMNTSAVTFSATRGGSAANLSAYSVAQTTIFGHPGAVTNGTFTSLRGALLSSANGGDSTLHGLTKTAAPVTQALNISGSDITASNILDKIFDAYINVRRKCRGNAKKVVMSYKHFGSVLKKLQLDKGAFQVTKDPKASLYGWTEIAIASTKTGEMLEIVAVQEMPDAEIFFIDLGTMTLRTNGGVKKRVSPEGDSFYEVRATTGYYYLVDVSLTGEMEYRTPSSNAVLYSISY